MSHILVVEDDEIIADYIQVTLARHHYTITLVADAESALQLLSSHSDFNALVLDRQLPGMDGMALLRLIKSDPALKHLPVVLETALGDMASVQEGLSAGAYYYLTKPLQPALLLAVVEEACRQHQALNAIQTSLNELSNTLRYIDSATFRCRTLQEARALAHGLAQSSPDPLRAVPGLLELLVNAVEHGNLGITYAEKTHLTLAGIWADEVNKRQNDPALGARQVTVTLTRTQQELSIVIQDEGQGFDWEQYLELSPERMFDPHGRGIAMARMSSFDKLKYLGNGNTVKVSWVARQ